MAVNKTKKQPNAEEFTADTKALYANFAKEKMVLNLKIFRSWLPPHSPQRHEHKKPISSIMNVSSFSVMRFQSLSPLISLSQFYWSQSGIYDRLALSLGAYWCLLAAPLPKLAIFISFVSRSARSSVVTALMPRDYR